jgi:hypothetical protein
MRSGARGSDELGASGTGTGADERSRSATGRPRGAAALLGRCAGGCHAVAARSGGGGATGAVTGGASGAFRGGITASSARAPCAFCPGEGGRFCGVWVACRARASCSRTGACGRVGSCGGPGSCGGTGACGRAGSRSATTAGPRSTGRSTTAPADHASGTVVPSRGGGALRSASMFDRASAREGAIEPGGTGGSAAGAEWTGADTSKAIVATGGAASCNELATTSSLGDRSDASGRGGSSTSAVSGRSAERWAWAGSPASARACSRRRPACSIGCACIAVIVAAGAAARDSSEGRTTPCSRRPAGGAAEFPMTRGIVPGARPCLSASGAPGSTISAGGDPCGTPGRPAVGAGTRSGTTSAIWRPGTAVTGPAE